MREKFNKQLAELYIEMKDMGAMCQKAIELSVKTLTVDNGENSKEDIEEIRKSVFEVDSEIDLKERKIENKCMDLLLRQQPVAGDLRTVSSALKMISDMERIGDQASDIAELSEYIRGCSVRHKLHLSEMSLATIKMVKNSIDSFVFSNLQKAISVMEDDDKVDKLFTKVKGELISIISTDNSDAELCLDLLMVAKYLERIGDHAVNIAEWVEYSITGNHRKM